MPFETHQNHEYNPFPGIPLTQLSERGNWLKNSQASATSFWGHKPHNMTCSVKICFLFAHCSKSLKEHLTDKLRKGNRTIVLIGPEGDFSEHEIKMAESLEYQSVTLGQSRLRTETAGIVACHIVNLIHT